MPAHRAGVSPVVTANNTDSTPAQQDEQESNPTSPVTALVDRDNATSPLFSLIRSWYQQEVLQHTLLEALAAGISALIPQLPPAAEQHVLQLQRWRAAVNMATVASAQIVSGFEQVRQIQDRMPTVSDAALVLFNNTGAVKSLAYLDSICKLLAQDDHFSSWVASQTVIGALEQAFSAKAQERAALCAPPESNTGHMDVECEESATFDATVSTLLSKPQQLLSLAHLHFGAWIDAISSLLPHCIHTQQTEFVQTSISTLNRVWDDDIAARPSSQDATDRGAAYLPASTIRVSLERLKRTNEMLEWALAHKSGLIAIPNDDKGSPSFDRLRESMLLQAWPITLVRSNRFPKLHKVPVQLCLYTNALLLVARKGRDEADPGSPVSTNGQGLAPGVLFVLLALEYAELVEPQLGLTMFSLNAKASSTNHSSVATASDTFICLAKSNTIVQQIKLRVDEQAAMTTS